MLDTRLSATKTTGRGRVVDTIICPGAWPELDALPAGAGLC